MRTYTDRTDLSSAVNCTPTIYAPAGSTKQTPCIPGTRQPEPKKGSCRRCNAGTFQEAEGQQTCQTCPQGFHCPEGGAAIQCEGGTFSSQTGAQSSEDCTGCPAGGAFCFAGSAAATSCSKGTYAAAERSQLCDACPEGK